MEGEKKQIRDIARAAKRGNAIDAARAARFAEAPPSPPAPAGKIKIGRYVLAFLVCAILGGAAFGFASYRAYSRHIADHAVRADADLTALGIASSTLADGIASDDPVAFVKTVIFPLVGSGRSAALGIGVLGSNIGTLFTDAAFFTDEAFADLSNGKGADIVAHLDEAHQALHAIASSQDGANGLAAILGNGSGVPGLNAELPLLDSFLGSLADWAHGTHRILVLFGNTSEIRPAGGFWGSYADVSFSDGNIVSVAVHDINDADRAFDGNVVPPYPLQAIESRWHIADANWFMNFPDSAATLTKFMNSASGSSSVPFDAVVSVSPKVIEDMLSATGPLTLSDGKTSVNADNFMRVIQASVEENQAKHAASPKSILSELEPLLLAKLEAAPADAQDALLTDAESWMSKKDLIVYFDDRHLEDFFDTLGWTGRLFKPAPDFTGDYFALTGANVGGGKTDLVMSESVDFQSRIDAMGTVFDHVTLARTHNGNKEMEWWYRLANQEYESVLTLPDSILQYAHGGFWKSIAPSPGYAKRGYARDSLVASVESTEQTFIAYPQVRAYNLGGLRAFTTWSKVAIGKTDTIMFDYAHKLSLPPADGLAYTFIFDKQPGTHRSYHFEIDAPPGFRFKENDLPAYVYQSDDPPGELTLTLKLKKMQIP